MEKTTGFIRTVYSSKRSSTNPFHKPKYNFIKQTALYSSFASDHSVVFFCFALFGGTMQTGWMFIDGEPIMMNVSFLDHPVESSRMLKKEKWVDLHRFVFCWLNWSLQKMEGKRCWWFESMTTERVYLLFWWSRHNN